MSIRIKTADALGRLTAALTDAEQAVVTAEQAVVNSKKEYEKFRKGMVQHVRATVKAEDITPVYWTREGVKLNITLSCPQGAEWPPEPWRFDTAVAEAKGRVDQIKELIKLVSLCASETVTVSSGVFKNLAQYL